MNEKLYAHISQKLAAQPDAKIFHVTPIFGKNAAATKKTVVNVGSARSGKSYAIAQLLIHRAMKEQGTVIGISRKTGPALSMTAYKLFIDMLKEYGVYNIHLHNKTEKTYLFKNGSFVRFFSLDDPEKIKSTEFNYIWLEEATEFTFNDYLILLTRLSGPIKKEVRPGQRNQMFLSLNPSDANGWICKTLLQQEDVEVIKSTFNDNPHLTDDYINILMGLKNIDYDTYRIYALGEWGFSKATVYSNYELVDKLPPRYIEKFYGLDFGFTVPSAFVKILYTDGAIYVDEVFYRPNMLSSDIIAEVRKEFNFSFDKTEEIYADAAEPDRIQELVNEGFNARPATKDVLNGIDCVKKKKLFITKRSVNLIKEIQEYRWKTDKDGNTLDAPVKFNDHALDALRYALYTKERDTVPMDTGIFSLGVPTGIKKISFL